MRRDDPPQRTRNIGICRWKADPVPARRRHTAATPAGATPRWLRKVSHHRVEPEPENRQQPANAPVALVVTIGPGRPARSADPGCAARSRRGSAGPRRRPGPAGSSSCQSRYRLPGKYGQASPQPMVITTSEDCTASVVRTFGISAEMSMPALPHGLHHRGVHGVGGGRAGRADLDLVPGEVGEEGGGHLGPAGVVDADEQHGRERRKCS